MPSIKSIVTGLVGIAAFGCIIYGSYWVAKTLSYKIFYEDMVKATIAEMIKPGALR